MKVFGWWLDRLKVEVISVDEDEDDDGVCDVCCSVDGILLDFFVYCDGCNVGVYVNCYGNFLYYEVLEGDWFCV